MREIPGIDIGPIAICEYWGKLNHNVSSLLVDTKRKTEEKRNKKNPNNQKVKNCCIINCSNMINYSFLIFFFFFCFFFILFSHPIFYVFIFLFLFSVCFDLKFVNTSQILYHEQISRHHYKKYHFLFRIIICKENETTYYKPFAFNVSLAR